MEVNAHGEVTRKYRKAAMLDRELARGTEEERALQEAFEAKEARQRAAARGAGQRRRLGSAGLRKVTLMFDGRARGMPTSSLGAVFELTLPASWDAKPCRKLLKHFVRSYAIKYPDDGRWMMLEVASTPSAVNEKREKHWRLPRKKK